MVKWKPRSDDYAAVFRSQNPWQSLGIVPEELAPPTRRPLANVLWRTLLDAGSKRHQIILGPRRVGKTTVMYQTVKQLLEQRMKVETALRDDIVLRKEYGQLIDVILRMVSFNPVNRLHALTAKVELAKVVRSGKAQGSLRLIHVQP